MYHYEGVDYIAQTLIANILVLISHILVTLHYLEGWLLISSLL